MKQVKSLIAEIRDGSPFKKVVIALLLLAAVFVWGRDFASWARLGIGSVGVSTTTFNVLLQAFFPLTFIAVFASWIIMLYVKMKNLLMGIDPEAEKEEKSPKNSARRKGAREATELLDTEASHRQALRTRTSQQAVQLVPNADGSIGPVPVLAPADADEAAFADQAS